MAAARGGRSGGGDRDQAARGRARSLSVVARHIRGHRGLRAGAGTCPPPRIEAAAEVDGAGGGRASCKRSSTAHCRVGGWRRGNVVTNGDYRLHPPRAGDAGTDATTKTAAQSAPTRPPGLELNADVSHTAP